MQQTQQSSARLLLVFSFGSAGEGANFWTDFGGFSCAVHTDSCADSQLVFSEVFCPSVWLMWTSLSSEHSCVITQPEGLTGLSHSRQVMTCSSQKGSGGAHQVYFIWSSAEQLFPDLVFVPHTWILSPFKSHILQTPHIPACGPHATYREFMLETEKHIDSNYAGWANSCTLFSWVYYRFLLCMSLLFNSVTVCPLITLWSVLLQV